MIVQISEGTKFFLSWLTSPSFETDYLANSRSLANFAYRSYIGTLVNGVWIGNPPGKLPGRVIDLGHESHPET
jgi:hypothetical protein